MVKRERRWIDPPPRGARIFPMKAAEIRSKKVRTISAIEQQGAVSVKQQIDEKMAEARQICTEWGWTGEKCILAWDRVENLQAEEAHQQTEELKQTAFEDYCQKHPETKEVIRGYDPWFGHWSEEERPRIEDN